MKQLLISKKDNSTLSSNTITSDKETQRELITSEKGTQHNRRRNSDQYLDEYDDVSLDDSLLDAYIRYGAFLKLLISFLLKFDQRFAFSGRRTFQRVAQIELEKFVRSLCRIPTERFSIEPGNISALESYL